MSFNSVRQLDVYLTLASAEKIKVGTLAQNRQGVFFQYDAPYLARFGAAGNLSPYKLKADTSLQAAPPAPHLGLHGVFADSLPDGWGLLLQDRFFRQQGLATAQITAMDRLAFVADRGMGALSYQPSLAPKDTGEAQQLADLGQKAQAVFDGQTEEVLAALVAAGSSGGARPKAQLYFAPGQYQSCYTTAKEGYEPWLVKFTSANFLLGHEEGVCEAAYLSMAEELGLQPPKWQLFTANNKRWLALQRFDVEPNHGRQHLLSASALLDADFRAPSLDYEDLIKVAGQLCRSPQAARLMFRRMVFNLFAINQDDHSKNWAFLMADNGQWQPAPFYDITYSPHPYNEHATAFSGYGKKPPVKAMQQLAQSAGYASWPEAQQDIADIADVVLSFKHKAQQLDINTATAQDIQTRLEQIYQDNKPLISAAG